MANQPQINYLSRDFTDIRSDLITFIKAYFPDQWQDFSIASPGMALLELNAYVGDILSYAVDKKFNELFLDGVRERRSAYRLAKTLGYDIPGVRPAISIADIYIEVPPTQNGPDTNYLPVYRSGMKVKGAGQIFETVADINFASDFSEDGIANRIIQPILNGNQDLIRYRIIKREKIKAGITKTYKVEVPESDSKAFYQLTLPENNVLEILSVVVFPGLNINTTPTYAEFNNFTYKYYEVDELADDKIFIEDDNALTTPDGLKIGTYIEVEKRFSKEFLSDGSCRLTFGGGVEDYDAYDAYLTQLTGSKCPSSDLDISNILNNTALGVKIPPNSTIFVQYRVGGGALSNVGSNTLQEVADINAVILGPNPTLNQGVIASTRANNPIPAIGGVGLPSVDELRAFIASNFASQKRCVTLEDYVARCYQIPGKFGAPFRINATRNDNKVILYILSRDGNGRLLSSSTSELQSNIARFITPFRMINDFIEINDGKVIDLQIEVDLFIDRAYNANEIKTAAINTITDFLNVEKWQMGDNIYVSQIVDILRNIPGIINVVDLRFYNMEGGNYSQTLIDQAVGTRVQVPGTGSYRTQILLVDNTIYGTPISMFQIKFPAADIFVRVS